MFVENMTLAFSFEKTICAVLLMLGVPSFCTIKWCFYVYMYIWLPCINKVKTTETSDFRYIIMENSISFCGNSIDI